MSILNGPMPSADLLLAILVGKSVGMGRSSIPSLPSGEMRFPFWLLLVSLSGSSGSLATQWPRATLCFSSVPLTGRGMKQPGFQSCTFHSRISGLSPLLVHPLPVPGLVVPALLAHLLLDAPLALPLIVDAPLAPLLVVVHLLAPPLVVVHPL